MVRIALDGMGGDLAPEATVKGAVLAKREGAEVVIVGNKERILPFLGAEEIEILHTEEAVGMDEAPSYALRRKRGSSMNRALELVKMGYAKGCVTAGNSGAALAFGIFTLGRIEPIDRPAITTLHPNRRGGVTILIDAGGNVDCRPMHLVQFALMGDAFMRCAYKKDNPRIGLLNNGEEETKGNELTSKVHGLLKEMPLNYVGFVEDIYDGKADVVLSDGFVGNVALKISEGIVETFFCFLKEALEKGLRRKIGALLLRDALGELRRKMDFEEIGGAPLLGVDGILIICHGRSGERAIKNAILMAKRYAEEGLLEAMKEALRESKEA
jgi:glycerol-3-phosphate acyltransferase PlsX